MSSAIKRQISQITRDFGFAKAGFALPAEPETYSVYLDWLAAGNHAGMNYLKSTFGLEARKDIRQLFPECKSILVLLDRYPAPDPEPDASLVRGRVAAYAQGQDYHQVIKSRVDAMMTAVTEAVETPISYKFFTDSGPVMEHDLAVRAGLGWIGKNSLLLNREQGSYTVIAEVLLNIPIEPDQPWQQEHCGSCTKCIDSCPTRCILPNRTVDARRCISYLTIENKKDIPAELRPSIGGWLFGCDICQQVCPWNQKLGEYDCDPAYELQLDQDDLTLSELLKISKQEFNRGFKSSPMGRAKQRGLARNAAVVLGNSKDQRFIEALAGAVVDHEEPQVRGHAAWALAEYGNQGGIILEKALMVETDEAVITEIKNALQT